VVFGHDSTQTRVAFNHASEDERLYHLNAIMRSATSYDDLIYRIHKLDQGE